MSPVDDQLTLGIYTVAAIWTLYLLASTPGRSQLGNVFFKARFLVNIVAHMLFSRDKSFSRKQKIDPDVIASLPNLEVRRVVFIRHGESEWNNIFNNGFGPGFPIRLVKGIFREFFLSSTRDSIFIDTPLSAKGVRQAVKLRESIISTTCNPVNESLKKGRSITLSALSGNPSGSTSVVVTSNLRRAAGTGVISLGPRLVQTGERVKVVSSLQEISRNMDTLSLSQPREGPSVFQHRSQLDPKLDLARLFDGNHNNGNKAVFGNGLTRLLSFAEWIFTRSEDTLVVNGHSLFFKYFFDTFLPTTSTHLSRKKKISNCGVVSFLLYKGSHSGSVVFRIEPESIDPVFGAFV
mmetsp:Transcript_29850/g.41281  ORF Transcript_29850/g.41281 Transcript_29850/m.41281 type:complete len:350 (+) Transcript_29850:164-1213(+)|eukprot:CAMPEP_0196580446 /NCGR_PEP_ID=MMETSP1081-20130531/28632_1 /TAXON_ID=36882 /ORGANISM="Pyramimonas amylifera, Strain CCMP720" /LENGTH=349 /DNA_ID=CAMNT_0041900309 /DNA_START=140 /DNA_END=1189 /DNA_ORIENTATION=-